MKPTKKELRKHARDAERRERYRLLRIIFDRAEKAEKSPKESAERKAPSDRGAVPIPAETRRPFERMGKEAS